MFCGKYTKVNVCDFKFVGFSLYFTSIVNMRIFELYVIDVGKVRRIFDV